MPSIPVSINGVSIHFKSHVNRDVHAALLAALKFTITPDVAAGHSLTHVLISSANDSHTMPSRHAQQKAVDISRINGKHMSIYYGSDAEVTAITDALQARFELAPRRRENFGPSFKRKSGADYGVSGHGDHIHFSVD